MEMNGQQRIPATREVVWAALNNPDVLKACIPGCQELTKTSETAMAAVAVIKVGPVSAKFQGAVTLSDLDPPNGYRITGEGQGGVAGFAKGSAIVRLEEQDGETLLGYQVSADIGGKLAQLGGRLIEATARKMSDAFFKKFSEEIQNRSAAQAAPASHAEGTKTTSSGPEQRREPRDEMNVTPRVATAAPRPIYAGAAPSPDRTTHFLLGAILVAIVATAILLFTDRVNVSGSNLMLSSEFIAGTILLVVAAIGYLLGRLHRGRASSDVLLNSDSFAALVQSGRE